jgi:pimeloyl-ACP methyl ester carboxylesterase
MSTALEPVTRNLAVDGATLAYDVRPAAAPSGAPVLLLVGSPMGAGGFGTLASHFIDRTVVTYDPRGVERSSKDEPATESTPEQHAEDIHAVIAAVGGGPVDLFASSGGAVNALALVATYPDDVGTLVAHEPPVAGLVPDHEAALAACRAVADAYRQSGFGTGMARFIGVVGHQGPFTTADAEAATPDPAMFGLPAADDGGRTDPLLFQNIITCTHYRPDIDALRAAPTRIVLAVGEESDGQLAYRGGLAVAERLGQEAVRFPGDHGGFLGGEYGQAGKPDEFAATLRGVLATPGGRRS